MLGEGGAHTPALEAIRGGGGGGGGGTHSCTGGDWGGGVGGGGGGGGGHVFLFRNLLFYRKQRGLSLQIKPEERSSNTTNGWLGDS